MNRKSLSIFSKAALTAAVLAAGCCYSCRPHPEQRIEAELTLEEDLEQEETTLQTAGETSKDTSYVSQEPCFVHVCGQVNRPGVYELEPGSRVYQAVEMAGGFGPDAAGWYLNLAQEIKDGMKIQVPTEEEARKWGPSASEKDGFSGGQEQEETKVNLNTADREQLMTLTGIGESRAADIIRYREEHGPFERIEDIMNISGIKEGAFQKIKDSITV